MTGCVARPRGTLCNNKNERRSRWLTPDWPTDWRSARPAVALIRREGSGDRGTRRLSAGLGRRAADRRGLRPDVRRARADLRRHAGDQFRPGRFHDARDVRGVLSVHLVRHSGCIRQHHRAVRRHPARRPRARAVRLSHPSHLDLARLRHAHRRARRRGSLRPAHSHARHRAGAAERRADRVRLGAGLDPHPAVEFGLGAWSVLRHKHLHQQGARPGRAVLAGDDDAADTADHAFAARQVAAGRGRQSHRGDLYGHRRRPRASRRLRARHRHHGDRGRAARHQQSVSPLRRHRLRHRHVCRRRARRHGQHHRRVLGRHDDRPGAADVDPGAADPIAERRDLRRVSPDHLLPPAGILRARGREDLTMRMSRAILPVIVFTVLYAAVSLTVSNSYYQLMLTLVPVWAIFGLSWNLLSGYTGLISFGHAAFFGIGAYATALGQIYFDLPPWVLIPVAGMLGGIAGLAIGFPTFRLQGHYFALAMLAYPLAILYVFEWLGFQEITLPIKRDHPIAYMQFGDPRIYTLLALAMMLATILLTLRIESSRFGMALLAIKQNEAAAEAAGINTLAWKLRAITLSGAIAGAIGGFYAVVLLVVTPQSVFGMLVSAQALTVAMFGGVGTVWGPVIGSVILIPLAETLNAEAGSRLPGIQGVIFGLAIICVILVAPEGLFWKVRDLLRKRSAPQVAAPPRAQDTVLAAPVVALPKRSRPQRSEETKDIVLEVRNLSRAFGGLKAVQDVSFKLRRNE